MVNCRYLSPIGNEWHNMTCKRFQGRPWAVKQLMYIKENRRKNFCFKTASISDCLYNKSVVKMLLSFYSMCCRHHIQTNHFLKRLSLSAYLKQRQHTKCYPCSPWQPHQYRNLILTLFKHYVYLFSLLACQNGLCNDETLEYGSFLWKCLHCAPPCGKTMSIKASNFICIK